MIVWLFCTYIFELDKYESKHTGRQTNVQTNIEKTYGQIKTDRQTGKI